MDGLQRKKSILPVDGQNDYLNFKPCSEEKIVIMI